SRTARNSSRACPRSRTCWSAWWRTGSAASWPSSRRRRGRAADMVSLARKNLLHDRMRSAITIAGVAFAVTLVLVQVGLFMGLLDKATTTIEHSSADIWVTSHETPNVDFAHNFPETTMLRVRSVPGVAKAENLILQ